MTDVISRSSQATRPTWLKWAVPAAVLTLALAGAATWLVARANDPAAACPGVGGPVPLETSGDTWRIECRAEVISLLPGEFVILVQWQTASDVTWEANMTSEGALYAQYAAPDGSFNTYVTSAPATGGVAHLLRVEGRRTGSTTELSVYFDGASVLRKSVPGDARPNH